MIGKARKDRTWEHMLKMERVIGQPLMEKPRWGEIETMCPVVSFAPDTDRDDIPFHHVWRHGEVVYVLWHHTSGEIEKVVIYQTHDVSDADWWDGLSSSAQRELTNWIQNKIKERNTK